MGTAWIVPGAEVVCFKRTSKGFLGDVEHTTVESVGAGRVRLVGSSRTFRIESRLSYGDEDGRTALFQKADGWGGRYVLLPADHPRAPEAGES